MANNLSEVLMALGWWVCHQDPARTISFGHVAMPLCIRCTGLYLSMGLVMWSGLMLPSPRRAVLGVSLAAIAALSGSGLLMLQWILAQLHVWPSTATNRLLTGYLAGTGLGLLLHVALSIRLKRPFEKKPAGSARTRVVGWMVMALSWFGSLVLLLLHPSCGAMGWILGGLSLAGFYSASGWGIAVILSYVMVDEENRPRRPLIVALALLASILEAAVLSVTRI